MNNRCLWLKELTKEGGQVLEYRVIGMHVWRMRDKPGCCLTIERTAQKGHLVSTSSYLVHVPTLCKY